jgi:hypothetical protein
MFTQQTRVLCMCFANDRRRFVAWFRRVSARQRMRVRSHECLELPHRAATSNDLMRRSERRPRVKIRVSIVGAALRLDWNQAHASDREIAPASEHSWTES